MKKLLSFCLFLLVSLPVLAEDNFDKAFMFADRKDWPQANYAARVTGHKLLKEYIFWRQSKEVDQRPDASTLLSFIESHRDWPDMVALLDRAAEALLLQGVNYQNAKRWQDLHDAFAEKRDQTKRDPVAFIVKHTWEHGEFNTAEQEQLLNFYAGQLGPVEIQRRVNYLLWNDKTTKARGLITHLPHDKQRLAYARIALQEGHHGIETTLSAVPASLKNDAGLIYDRMRWRSRKGLSDGVLELLRTAPPRVPHAAKWWKYRAIAVRDAIDSGALSRGLALLQNHGQSSGAELADALWLRGWLTLRVNGNAGKAYQDFYDMYHHVKFPVSLSRAAFWAAMAAKLNGNNDISNNWYKEAAKFPTTFYGQLAMTQLGISQLSLPSVPNRNSPRLSAGERDVLTLVRLLARYNQKFSVEKFLSHLAMRQKAADNLYALAALAREIHYPHLSVRIAKIAMQERHLWLESTSHPIRQTVADNAIEPALALAISRQESEFNPEARSPANALGLMQLLPSTAQQVARKWGVPYSQGELFNPQYNMRLGSYYLSGLVDKFGSTYPLAIASYNAGPGNVNRWVGRYGPLPQDLFSRLNWLESIPFLETRNYVQRVLENLQVYRAMLKTGQPLSEAGMFGK